MATGRKNNLGNHPAATLSCALPGGEVFVCRFVRLALTCDPTPHTDQVTPVSDDLHRCHRLYCIRSTCASITTSSRSFEERVLGV